MLSCGGGELGTWNWKLCWGWAVGSVKFGRGNRFKNARPMSLIRLAGILFPGKHPAAPVAPQAAPVSGSRIRIGVPLVFTDWEKSPLRWSAVGIVYRLGPAIPVLARES